MKRIKFLSIVTGVVLILAMIVFVTNVDRSQAAEKCEIVQILPNAIQPEHLFIHKGDCVVWMNWSRGEDVKVIFREGKKCADISKAPSKFEMDAKGCYVTGYLPFGATSSLLFVERSEQGRLDYEVEFPRSEKIVRGSIIIK